MGAKHTEIFRFNLSGVKLQYKLPTDFTDIPRSGIEVAPEMVNVYDFDYDKEDSYYSLLDPAWWTFKEGVVFKTAVGSMRHSLGVSRLPKSINGEFDHGNMLELINKDNVAIHEKSVAEGFDVDAPSDFRIIVLNNRSWVRFVHDGIGRSYVIYAKPITARHYLYYTFHLIDKNSEETEWRQQAYTRIQQIMESVTIEGLD